MPSSVRNCSLNYLVENEWEPRYLKAKCKELGIEKEFNAYLIRLFSSYVSVFFAFHISTTIVHCIFIVVFSEHKKYIYFDVGMYVGCCLLLILILSINFCKRLIRKHTWIMFVSSALACFILVCTDMIQSLYHHFLHDWHCGTFYDTYIYFMIYTFLPILSIWNAIILAIVVCCAYLSYFINVIYSEFALSTVSNNLAFSLSINAVCILFRVVNDMVVRSSFIDRHQFIIEMRNLRHAQRQEKLLLDSILPTQFSELLQTDIKKRLIKNQRSSSAPIEIFTAFSSSVAIQIHSDVSILYADVVNYTHLTTTLTVAQLVTTLHDLYGRFDLAAQHFDVQRIKFLGDCYYCVAGLTLANPDHANNAVALGLSMIAHIQDVRNLQGLDIDMRIGIHSGSLFAGVIGEAKLQYDVWGRDVTIANALEATGVPGAVHISQALLNNLESDVYTIKSGPEKAKNDPLLKKYKITTYLIESNLYHDDDGSLDSRDLLSYFYSSKSNTRTHGSLANVVNFDELREEYRKMPVLEFDPRLLFLRHKKPSQNRMDFFLAFYDPSLEKPYLRQKDYLSKYYMLLSWIVGFCEIHIQVVDNEELCIYCIVLNAFVIVILTVFTILAWYKKICWMIYGKKQRPHTYNRISCSIFRLHEKMQKSMQLRVYTFLFIMVMHWGVIGVAMMDCNHANFILRYIEEKIYRYESKSAICFDPWETTSMMSLMTCMAFTFFHIPFLLKTFLALAQVIIYCILIFFQFDFVFHHSITTNPYFPSEYSHALIIVITFLNMFFKAKQTEFYKKVNFRWRNELENKQSHAAMTNRSIIILLNNILPSHVVEIYLGTLERDELYYENYKMVSVMFATLSNFQLNLSNLRILNDVITQFDKLLFHYKHYVVEKIKIANFTYIAACGLDVSIAGSTSKPVKTGSTIRDKLGSAIGDKLGSTIGDKPGSTIGDKPRSTFEDQHLQLSENEDRDEVVLVMASFALDLMRTLSSCNKAYNGIIKGYDILDGMITIGISSGEIMAGIVGALKPHYDIWGNPVNMASRMGTTGLVGHIQVTEESANILQEFGIQCNYRGRTFVKGRGPLPTYFVGIDEQYNFIQREGTRKSTLKLFSSI